jgi:hypothetical protein
MYEFTATLIGNRESDFAALHVNFSTKTPQRAICMSSHKQKLKITIILKSFFKNIGRLLKS